MNKRLLSAVTASVLCLAASQLTASAETTVDDVAAVARSYGISEEDIQLGYNAYNKNPEKYPPEKLDKVIASLHETGGNIVSLVPYDPNYVFPDISAPAETTAPSGDTESSNTAETPVTEQPQNNMMTLTAPDGSSFTRISAEDFIAMSYDEKMAYLSGFTQDKQQVIIDNLTPAEYKSIIRQAPAEKKMEIVHSLSGAADEMGFSITVDEVTDDSLTLSMRNEEGTLVNVTGAGAAVEDTGYDRRGIFAAAAAAFLAALSGLMLIADRCFTKDETEGINGK